MPTLDSSTPILDQWSGFSHKAPLSDGTRTPSQLALAPSWVPASEHRRLTAYRIARAYLANMARVLLTDQTNAKQRREYGDAALIVQRVVAGILGDTTSIVVDGADDDLSEGPDLPERPEAPADDADPLDKRIATALLAEWTRRAEATVTQWETALEAQPDLQQRQAWLRQWADDEFLAGKTVDCELDAVGLGDGVYALHPSAEHGRPTLAVHDPGFYFPVLDDNTVGYPRKVHIAWEYDTNEPTPRRMVRRLTWELVDLTAANTVLGPDGPEWADGVAGESLVQRPGQTITADGRLVRTYPWHAEGQDPSGETCLYSDVTWEWKNLGGRKADDFDLDKAVDVVANRVDLGIDFIPVVHVPNTPATREHFGTSTLALIAQILDDLSKSDTDIQAAASIAALPLIALASALDIGQERLVVKAGVVFKVGENGRMDVLDMSKNLSELRSSRSELGDRLSVNAQVPAEVLGRAEAVGDLSGIAIALRFGPFEQLINLLRLTRDQKYRLLIKMVQRIAQTMPGPDGQPLLPSGPTPLARLAFGSFLPSDVGQTVDQVVSLLQAHGLSRRSALQQLVDAGVEIDDITEELAAIAAEDTEGAVRVADATGSETAAAKLLGVDPADIPAPVGAAGPPTIQVNPPSGGGAG